MATGHGDEEGHWELISQLTSTRTTASRFFLFIPLIPPLHTHTHTHTHSYPAVPQVTDIRDWEDEEGGEVGNSTESSSEEEEGMMADHSLDSQLPLLVLPLYSLLSTKLQTKVCVVIAITTPTSLSYKQY